MRSSPLSADALDHAEQRTCFDPNLRPPDLVAPRILAVLARGIRDDVGRIVPGRMGVDLAGAVLDGVPVDLAGAAAVLDDFAQALAFRLFVLKQVAGDDLIIKLPQRYPETLPPVFSHDLVAL